MAAVLLAAGILTVPTATQAAEGDVGFEGPSHTGTGTPTGTKRAESVLWCNDGFWWGNMWDTGTSDFHIFRFEEGTRTWVDTGVTTETRANTHHDVLWDGTTLFVASHMFVDDGVPAASGFPSTLRRYSYNATTNTYTSQGSSQINNMRTETLVIDKDSHGPGLGHLAAGQPDLRQHHGNRRRHAGAPPSRSPGARCRWTTPPPWSRSAAGRWG